MQIELKKITQITPYPGNPRINDEAVESVAASLKEFGFRQPIVIDAQGVIIVGHTHYKAAVKLGMAKVPVHVATDLTETQARAYRVADNRSAELSHWDYDLLPIELAGLRDAGVDTALLGWDAAELERLLTDGPPSMEPSKEFDGSAADQVQYTECPACGHKFPK